jgi:hypothetical protein
MSLTNDEYKQLLAKIREREEIEGKRISVSQFLRDTFIPLLNGDSIPNPDIKPPTYDIVSEGGHKTTKENVSPDARDTISKSYEFNLD